MESRLSFTCTKCGSDKFAIPSDPKDNDLVACAGCGGTVRYADLRASAIEQARELVKKSLSGLFRK